MNYKEPAGVYGMGVYAIVHSIVLAMQKAGTTTDAWKIRQAAPSVVPIPDKYNTMAVKAWEENGEGVMAQKLGRYRNGKLVVIK